MDPEPQNPASDMTRLLMPRLAEPEFREGFPDRVSDGFVMEDRRKVVGSGPMDIGGTVEFAAMLHELGGDTVITVEEVLAVRGRRLTAVKVRYLFPETEFVVDSLLVIQYDRPVWRTDRVIQFDIDDPDAAIAELDRLQAEIEI